MIAPLVISALWLILAIAFFFLIRDRYRSLGTLQKPIRKSDHLPSVAVIVPARNEAENIEECVWGLQAQEYPEDLLKIYVVDDQSGDQTASIVEGLARADDRLQLLRAPPLPTGWHGKQHACWHGAENANAEWLCFIDADTRQAPALIAAAVQNARDESIALLSLHPQQIMEGFWERLLMPVPFITLMILMNARKINDPASKAALANGQFILVRSEVYAAVDGHRSVRGALLEDVELGKLVKGCGYSIAIRGGGDLISTRMYRDLPTLWSALARNGSELFGPAVTAFAVLNAFTAAFFPWFFPLWLGARIGADSLPLDTLAFSAALTGSIVYYGLHALALRIYKVPLRYLLMLPVSDLLIGVINLQGLIQRVRGRRSWKGRQV